MINECSVLKELFLDLEGNKVSEKKDADYKKIETLMGSCGKEKLAQALEGLNVCDSLMRDMTGESAKIVMHSLSVFCSVLEVKPEIVKRPEALLRGLVSVLQSNLSLPKSSNVVIKALKCICMICPVLKTLGKDVGAIKNILLHYMLDSERNIPSDLKVQALCLFKSLLQHKLITFTDTSNWLKLLFNLIFDSSPSIREAALQAADVLKHKLTGDEEYLDTLANTLVPDKFRKMMMEMMHSDRNWAVAWRLLVEILGRRLHSSSSLVNSLLAVEEKAFKTSNVETKKEAFNCWNSLLLNFALEHSVLSSEKRVKLLTIPLKANNSRNGDVALVKLNVWWNTIRLLKSDVGNYADMIFSPFLAFCYGNASESTTTNGSGRLNSSNAGEACAKLYPVLRAPSLHALCEILSKSAKLPMPAALAKDLAIPPLGEPPIVSPKLFCSLSRLLIHCLGEAVNLEGQDTKLMPYVIHCWNSLLVLVCNGGDEPLCVGDSVSKDAKTLGMVKDLLRLVTNLVEAPTAANDTKTAAVIVSMIESIVTGDYAFAPVILNSQALGVGNMMIMTSCPTLLLCTLLMSPGFAVEKQLHPRIKDVFSKLIQIGFSNTNSALPFVGALLKRMDRDASENTPSIIVSYYQDLWILIANHLSNVIDKDGSVSEGNGAGHDFHCMYGMLMLPIVYALKIDMPHDYFAPALKSWGRLFDLFVIYAQLVVTAQSYEIVEELCRKILSLYKKCSKPWSCMANGIQYIWVMFQRPYFETHGKGHSKKQPKDDKPVALPASQQLLVLLSSKIVSGLTSGENADNVSRHKMIMSFFVTIFSSPGLSAVPIIFEKGIQGLTFYLKLTSDVKQRQQFGNEMNIMWEKFLQFVEKVLKTSPSKPHSIVESLYPVLIEAFKHPLDQIVEKTKQSWNSYLGEFFSSVYIPKSLTEVLDDALKDMSSSEDDLSDMVSTKSPKSVFAVPERSRGKAKEKAAPSAKAKESHAVPRAKEDSVEFKVIPPRVKASVLTDHQKEIMKERRVDIPALYQDLTQDSVSQSFSQDVSPPVLEPAVSGVDGEDANSAFAPNLRPEPKLEKVAEGKKVLTFTLPISGVTTSAKKGNAAQSISASASAETNAIPSDVGNGDSKIQEVEVKDPPVRRRKGGRKRKHFKNFEVAKESEPLSNEKVKSNEVLSSEVEEMNEIPDLNAAEPINDIVTDSDAMDIEPPHLPCMGADLVPETSTLIQNVEAMLNMDKVSKDEVTADAAPSTSKKCEGIVVDPDTSEITPKNHTTVSPTSVFEPCLQMEPDVEMTNLESRSPVLSALEIQVPETLSNCADGSDSGVEKDAEGLSCLKISSPRKISEVEFSQTLELNSGAGSRESRCVDLSSPNCKASPASVKGRTPPVSPRVKSAANSPSLDKWVIVTKRESEDKSPAKSPLKTATSDDLVDSSQDPFDSPSIQHKGAVKKCSINLSRVSDILPEEVAFIQYEGRTVKCHMSPRKEEGKVIEEPKKVTPLCSPVVSNIFSPRNSRGARMLNLAQGNKEKSSTDEILGSPVRDAADKGALHSSDNNLQQSPLSHLRSCDVNNSTPPNKKPRRIRPVHIGSVSPQFNSMEIGCVASEREVVVHSYSPNASPGGSLMKRKKPPGEDSISPLSKKAKRVSFADPIVSRQVEFCVPDSERNFKKRVHRCLKLPGSSLNSPQSSLPDLNNDLGVITQVKRTSTLQSPQSTPAEEDDNRLNDEAAVLSQCNEKAVDSEKVQAVDQSGLDSVKILNVVTTIPTDGEENGVSVILDTVEEPNVEIHSLPAEKSVTVNILMEQSPTRDSEPGEMEVGANIDPTQKSAVENDERLAENTIVSENLFVTIQTSSPKDDSSTDISNNSDKSVSSPEVATPEEFVPDSISSSHQSLESPKTSSESPEVSMLESQDMEEPRTDKLNSQDEAYPPLRDCQDPLGLIIEKLTTRYWRERCRQAFDRRGIVTIGDLSRLTEVMVEKIPIKTPKWRTVIAELKEYHSQHSKTNESSDTPEIGGRDHPAVGEVVVGDNSKLQIFREMLSSMSAQDILKELHACNKAEAVLQKLNLESPISQNITPARIQKRGDKLSKISPPPKKFESISVQVSEFEVLSELQLMLKKNPLHSDAISVSTQVSDDDLLPVRNEDDDPKESEPPEAPKEFQSISVQHTLSEIEMVTDKSVQVSKPTTAIAVQVSEGEILSRMDSYDVLNLLYGRSDLKDAISGLSSEKLMHLLKLVVRSVHSNGQWFDGSVDQVAKSLINCVVKEMMKDDQPVDTTKVIMWILQKTLFSKEYVKIIPSILSGVDDSVVSEIILSQENIMNKLQAQLPAARGLKLAVDVLEQRNINLLPEDEIDRLNDIIDSHRTCVELFDRYTRVVRGRIMGNNISR
ncbi:telomere-associated protein RIF1 isoform X2 [Ischnura elegans]|uniref:telomere-associated protein RIF1 isoform X2 n=1 Tax=Ischnura elegans TaxID=197161 RepID=UPI001ED88A28|nr:telomere-associated protein RIF1 isoform X2 [Ischnura elegans]